MDVALRTVGLGKRYRRYPPERPRTIKDAAIRGFRPVKKETFWAIRDVTLEIPMGRTVGFIGANGAGKSTLLRLLAGVEQPNEGSVEVGGRIGALLELGASFHPELTGRENASLAAVVAGLTRSQARARIDEIVAFAQLEEFIDNPLRTYSSGMKMRLAFSVASHVDPEILLVDEALAVGDISFQQRCIDRIQESRKAGVTIVIVSHDPNRVRDLCDEVVWIRAGRVIAQGTPMDVVARYVESQAEATRKITPETAPLAFTPEGERLEVHRNRFGSLEATISSAWITDVWGERRTTFETGSGMSLEMDLTVPIALGEAWVSATIRRSDDVLCMDTCSMFAAGQHNNRVRVDIERLDLAAGDYVFDIGLFNSDWSRTFDYHYGAYPFRISGVTRGAGVMAPPISWQVLPRAVAR